MKLLLTMHIGGRNTIEKTLKQQLLIKAILENQNIQSDTFIYYTENQDIKNSNFIGNVFIQKIDYLSPTFICNQIIENLDLSLYEGIIISEDELSNDIAVILADRLNYKCVTNVHNFSISNNAKKSIFTRFSYNNNVLIDYEINGKFCTSLRGLKILRNIAKETKCNIHEIKTSKNPKFISKQKLITTDSVFFESDILFVVGMGVEEKSEVERLRDFASSHKISFGVSRPVAMRGWGKISEIVGVSGNIYSPKIAIVIGVSGAAAFYVGIENSDYILSINKNEDAPIINLSNDIIIADYKTVINDILDLISKSNR
jgi:electron transfer flavoprotein alpha subunit